MSSTVIESELMKKLYTNNYFTDKLKIKKWFFQLIIMCHWENVNKVSIKYKYEIRNVYQIHFSVSLIVLKTKLKRTTWKKNPKGK